MNPLESRLAEITKESPFGGIAFQHDNLPKLNTVHHYIPGCQRKVASYKVAHFNHANTLDGIFDQVNDSRAVQQNLCTHQTFNCTHQTFKKMHFTNHGKISISNHSCTRTIKSLLETTASDKTLLPRTVGCTQHTNQHKEIQTPSTSHLIQLTDRKTIAPGIGINRKPNFPPCQTITYPNSIQNHENNLNGISCRNIQTVQVPTVSVPRPSLGQVFPGATSNIPNPFELPTESALYSGTPSTVACLNSNYPAKSPNTRPVDTSPVDTRNPYLNSVAPKEEKDPDKPLKRTYRKCVLDRIDLTLDESDNAGRPKKEVIQSTKKLETEVVKLPICFKDTTHLQPKSALYPPQQQKFTASVTKTITKATTNTTYTTIKKCPTSLTTESLLRTDKNLKQIGTKSDSSSIKQLLKRPWDNELRKQFNNSGPAVTIEKRCRKTASCCEISNKINHRIPINKKDSLSPFGRQQIANEKVLKLRKKMKKINMKYKTSKTDNDEINACYNEPSTKLNFKPFDERSTNQQNTGNSRISVETSTISMGNVQTLVNLGSKNMNLSRENQIKTDIPLRGISETPVKDVAKRRNQTKIPPICRTDSSESTVNSPPFSPNSNIDDDDDFRQNFFSGVEAFFSSKT